MSRPGSEATNHTAQSSQIQAINSSTLIGHGAAAPMTQSLCKHAGGTLVKGECHAQVASSKALEG